MNIIPISISQFYASQGTAETVDQFMPLYVVPTGKYAEISVISISNTDEVVAYEYQLVKRTSKVTNNFYLINSGGVDVFMNTKLTLQSGDSLLFYSDKTTTQITISGEERELGK